MLTLIVLFLFFSLKNALFFCSITKAEAEEEEAPKREKTSFSVKLVKFDAGKKVALIKEIKNSVEGLNLVQVLVLVHFTYLKES